MERTQFTFYESFARALKRIKKDADRAKAYDTICDYALYGVEPDCENLPDSVAIAFDLIRPNLDASKKKAVAGRLGGKHGKNASTAEANGSKTEANASKTQKLASEKENEIEGEKEVEIEKESLSFTGGGGNAQARDGDPPLNDPELARVMSFYLDKINPSPSTQCTAALIDYTKRLSADVVLHALGIALDERNFRWSYIQGILGRYSQEKLTSIEAVLRSEQEITAQRSRNERKGGGQDGSAGEYQGAHAKKWGLPSTLDERPG